MRTAFRGILPMSPKRVGLVKQPTLITYFIPAESFPLTPFIGSQSIFGIALPEPPVNSVIIVQTLVDVWSELCGLICPAVIVTVPLVKFTLWGTGLSHSTESV